MKKHIKNFVCGAICIIIIIGAFFSVNKLTKKEKVELKGKKYILELWHIDTFEGGKASRKDFLLSSALKFEKNSQVIVSVISHTIESAILSLKNYQPDLISCGNGIDISNYVKSIPISTQDGVCNISKKSFGVSWCRGGYALIGQGEKNDLIVSQGEYNLPLQALKLSGENFKNIQVLPPQKAYQQYLKKGGYLLGTQRDIIRLNNLEKEVKYQPISSFCDLYQVICVTTQNKEKISYCESFISFLLSYERQMSLKNIGMLSTTGQDVYKGEYLQDLQRSKIKENQNFFTNPQILKNINLNLQQELKIS